MTKSYSKIVNSGFEPSKNTVRSEEEWCPYGQLYRGIWAKFELGDGIFTTPLPHTHRHTTHTPTPSGPPQEGKWSENKDYKNLHL